MANNVSISQDKDGKVVIVFDPKMSLGDSKSGKTTIVASTYGFERVLTSTGSVSISLNVTRSK